MLKAMLDLRPCLGCDILRPSTEFNSKRGCNDGLDTRCKECNSEANSRWRQKSRADDIVGFKLRRLVCNARARALLLGIAFDIDAEYLRTIMPDECPVLGYKFVYDSSYPVAASLTLDQYRPRGGYTKGNVYLLSHKANAIKNDGTFEEHKRILEWMARTESEVRAELNL